MGGREKEKKERKREMKIKDKRQTAQGQRQVSRLQSDVPDVAERKNDKELEISRLAVAYALFVERVFLLRSKVGAIL